MESETAGEKSGGIQNYQEPEKPILKAYETWSHLLVEENGNVHLLAYDQVESSLAFYEHGGKLYRVTSGGVYPESPMCLDIALSCRKRRNGTADASGAANQQRPEDQREIHARKAR